MGKNGSKAFVSAYDEATASTLSVEDAFEGFAKVYNAALKGETVESSLPAHMKLAAEYAGQNDAIRAEQAAYWGEESGVVKDSYFKKAHLSSRTVRVLDAIAKTAGVKIQFAETVTDSKGRAANASYGDGVVTIALDTEDPVRAAFTHEIVHRIRETAPAQYQALASFVQNHMSQQTMNAMLERYAAQGETTISGMTEEMVADAFATMLGDSKAMEQFVRDDRNAAEKLRDVILDLINAVKRILNGQNVRLTQDQRDSFMELKSDLEGMEKALTEALEAIPKEGQKNTATVGGEVKYSAKTQAEVTKQYEKAVDAILNGTSKIQDSVLLGYTPEIYRELGMPSLPFVVGAGHIYSAAKTEAEARSEGKYNSKTNYHGLGGQAVKKLYQAASKPIAIISAKDVDANATPMRSTHSVVAIVNVGSGKNSLLLPIEITATRRVDGQQMDVNVLSSAYKRNVEGLINEAVAQENVGQTGVYFIKNEASALIGAGVQFPKRLQEAMASNGIVRRFSEKVNMNILEQTQSRQFKRWFGDWQNKPQKASKVVNSDGTPRIVYHGTNADFRTFQSKDGLYWFSESEDYAESMAEERGGDRVMQAYLNMRNPYRAKLAPGKFSDPSAEAPIIRAAKAGNHDGVIIEVDTDNELEMDTVYIVFDQNQIKSATDNIGTFDRNNPNIEYSLKSAPGSWAKTAETARRMADIDFIVQQLTEERHRSQEAAIEQMAAELRGVRKEEIDPFLLGFNDAPGENGSEERPHIVSKRGVTGQNSETVEAAIEQMAAELRTEAEGGYTNWLKSIGAESTELNTLEKYNQAKYNNSPEYQLLSGYSRAVEKGDVSPLVGFEEYKQTNHILQERVVGLTTATGVKIESFATHFIDRVIGQTSTPHNNMRLGVSVEDAIDALVNPWKPGPVRTSEDGDIRQTLYGEKAAVTFSIRDKRIIQINPLGG